MKIRGAPVNKKYVLHNFLLLSACIIFAIRYNKPSLSKFGSDKIQTGMLYD